MCITGKYRKIVVLIVDNFVTCPEIRLSDFKLSFSKCVTICQTCFKKHLAGEEKQRCTAILPKLSPLYHFFPYNPADLVLTHTRLAHFCNNFLSPLA